MLMAVLDFDEGPPLMKTHKQPICVGRIETDRPLPFKEVISRLAHSFLQISHADMLDQKR